MKEISKVKDKFEISIKEIEDLTNIGLDVSNICLSSLKNLQEKHKDLVSCKEYSLKVDAVIKVIEGIRGHQLLKEKYDILYGESLALIVSRFESFMNDIFKVLINYYPERIAWKENKRVSIDVNLLGYSHLTMGELIVKSLRSEISFQDLQSTIRFLADYLKITKELITEEERNQIIFFQAVRNVIVHNNYIIDNNFLRQIRGTPFYLKFKKKVARKILINKDIYDKSKEIFLKFAQSIILAIEELEPQKDA